MTFDLKPHSFKRRKVAFGEDVEMSSADTEGFHAWTIWRDCSAGVASVFLTSDAKGVMAIKYCTHLLTDSLDMKGVDDVLRWESSALHTPTPLLYLAPYEQHTVSRFDVSEATWKSLFGPSTMGADNITSDHREYVAVEREIDALERRIVRRPSRWRLCSRWALCLCRGCGSATCTLRSSVMAK